MKINIGMLALSILLLAGCDDGSKQISPSTNSETKNTDLVKDSQSINTQNNSESEESKLTIDEESSLISDLLTISFSKALSGDPTSLIKLLNIPQQINSTRLEASLVAELSEKYHSERIDKIAIFNVRLSENQLFSLVDYKINYKDSSKLDQTYRIQLNKIDGKWKIDCPFDSCLESSEMIRVSPQLIAHSFIHSIITKNEPIFLQTLMMNDSIDLTSEEGQAFINKNRELLAELNEAFSASGEVDHVILNNIAYNKDYTRALTQFDLIFKNGTTQITDVPTVLLNDKWYIDWSVNLDSTE